MLKIEAIQKKINTARNDEQTLKKELEFGSAYGNISVEQYTFGLRPIVIKRGGAEIFLARTEIGGFIKHLSDLYSEIDET